MRSPKSILLLGAVFLTGLILLFKAQEERGLRFESENQLHDEALSSRLEELRKLEALLKPLPEGDIRQTESNGKVAETRPKPSDELEEKDSTPGEGEQDITENVPVDEISELDQAESRVLQKVVILTYMRSGSTFTGNLFESHEDAFYVYEPLWRLQKKHFAHDEVMYFRKPNIKANGDVMDSRSEAAHTLQAVLSCDFLNVDIDTLKQGHMVSSKDTAKFRFCVMSHPGIEGVRQCLRELYVPCKQRRVTVAKTIRFSMTQAGKLLEADPAVKIIHLVRDPRGMFRSQRSVADIKWGELPKESKLRCNRIMKDIHESVQLSERFPKRILTVRYEDIAERPQESAEQMYSFVGLRMTDRLRSYIHNITYAGRPDDCTICATRSNSTRTAYKWREGLDFASVRTIDQSCAQVYDVMGFRPYEKEEDVLKYLPKLDTFSDVFYKLKYR
ncbi:carbohydrate sulfotransferase 4, partial [Aplysia californica]|uniref:Carbohydrate sulfotransferase 4 n=1 Tax=Aplysia californica TaxID=6500 RepID=A0ABM1AEF2_APLCA